ncbi:MAG: hypothetical protein R2932_27585 [Caldilineaceae bacterium]
MGATLYTLLTGQRPPDLARVSGFGTACRQLNSQISHAMERDHHACTLSLAATDRFDDVEEMRRSPSHPSRAQNGSNPFNVQVERGFRGSTTAQAAAYRAPRVKEKPDESTGAQWRH